MKIRDIISEAGILGSIGKGLAKALAPNTTQVYDRYKATSTTPAGLTDREQQEKLGIVQQMDVSRKLQRIADTLGTKSSISMSDIGQVIGKVFPTKNSQERQQLVQQLADRLARSKVTVTGTRAPTPQPAATVPTEPTTVPSAILGPDGKPIQKPAAVQPAQPVQPTAAAQPSIVVPPATRTRQPADAQGYQSPLGVTVAQASDAGITLKYKNRNFMLNNRGEWAMDGKDTAGSTASQQLQAEMDKVAKSTGYME